MPEPLPQPIIKGLKDALSAKIRQRLYILFGLVGIAFGASQVYLLAVESPTPLWLKGATAVFGFLTTTLLSIAASNINPTVTFDGPAPRRALIEGEDEQILP